MERSEKIKALNLEKALELYDLLGKYIPDATNIDMLAFIGKMIDSIIDDDGDIYFRAIQLMTGLKEKDVLKMDAEELFIAFSDYILANKILELQQFCVRIGYNNARDR
jgi:hypothetical protein